MELALVDTDVEQADHVACRQAGKSFHAVISRTHFTHSFHAFSEAKVPATKYFKSVPRNISAAKALRPSTCSEWSQSRRVRGKDCRAIPAGHVAGQGRAAATISTHIHTHATS